jgi:hypothetical protein
LAPEGNKEEKKSFWHQAGYGWRPEMKRAGEVSLESGKPHYVHYKRTLPIFQGGFFVLMKKYFFGRYYTWGGPKVVMGSASELSRSGTK